MANFYGQYVGFGAGGVAGYVFQGEQFGYIHGGQDAGSKYDIIERFSFTSDGNAADVGDLDVTMASTSGSSSETHGYAAGATTQNAIGRYAFLSSAAGADVGDLTSHKNSGSGNTSETHGYQCGGWDFTAVAVSGVKDKYAFASSGDGSDIGDLSVTRLQTSGHTDGTFGYNACGAYESTNYNNVDRWAYASEGDSVDIGDMTVAQHRMGGLSSLTHGYVHGGPSLDVIDKFTFASSTTSDDVGNLSGGAVNQIGQSGNSSTTHGYMASCGGLNVLLIQKVAFASDGDADDVGNLTVARSYTAGTQL